MSSNKSHELKQFLIHARKSTGPGYTSAPVQMMRKANKRIYSTKQKRSWKNAEFGEKFRSRQDKLKNAKRIRGISNRRKKKPLSQRRKVVQKKWG